MEERLLPHLLVVCSFFRSSNYLEDSVFIADPILTLNVVMNSIGSTCLVASPAERERGGSSKLVEAM